jgi:carbonic anhydrase
VTEFNVANTLQQIYEQSSILKDMIDHHEIGLVGAVYDVSTGKVHFRDFSPILLGLKGKKINQILASRLTALVDESVKVSG